MPADCQSPAVPLREDDLLGVGLAPITPLYGSRQARVYIIPHWPSRQKDDASGSDLERLDRHAVSGREFVGG